MASIDGAFLDSFHKGPSVILSADNGEIVTLEPIPLVIEPLQTAEDTVQDNVNSPRATPDIAQQGTGTGSIGSNYGPVTTRLRRRGLQVQVKDINPTKVFDPKVWDRYYGEVPEYTRNRRRKPRIDYNEEKL
jgi:hypothetical protein